MTQSERENLAEICFLLTGTRPEYYLKLDDGKLQKAYEEALEVRK